MSGGGPKTSTTSQKMPAWLVPYAKSFMGGYGEAAFGPGWTPEQAAIPISRPESLDQRVAGFTPEQLAALEGIGGLTGPMQETANLGTGEIGQTLAGSYLAPESNPWLRKTYELAARDVMGSMAGAALRSGAFGSSGHQQEVGRATGDLATKIYGGNYQAERGRQMQALQMLPQTMATSYLPQYSLYGAGAQRQEQQQTEFDVDYTNAVAQFEYPFNILSSFGGAIGQAGGGAGTSTTKMSGGAGGGLFGK